MSDVVGRRLWPAPPKPSHDELDEAAARFLHVEPSLPLSRLGTPSSLTRILALIEGSATPGRKAGGQTDPTFIDLDEQPPDPALANRLAPEEWLATGCLPWRRSGPATLILTDRLDGAERQLPRLQALFGLVRFAEIPHQRFRQAVLRLGARRLIRRAESRVAPQASARTLRLGPLTRLVAPLLVVLAAAVWVAPWTTISLASLAMMSVMLLNVALKLAALLAVRVQGDPAPLAGREREAPPQILPVISLLVPLYRERAVAARLLRALEAIDYPRERLDICLILESDDLTTRRALELADLPPWAQIVTVPKGSLRTKPRALNFALDFARGSIIGIYDAEDSPAPDQLRRVAATFSRRGPQTACLQGALDYYNPRQNWIARCFALEYAAWFRVLLPGLVRLGLVIPLGGTTLFLRRRAIEEVGGWDAHNVTEDADLGVRLARHGFRTDILPSTTYEEANARTWPWIRQRSRWLKGYAQTWAVHTRRPGALIRDIGLVRAGALQVLLLGTLLQFLLGPVLWIFWLALVLAPVPPVTPLVTATANIAAGLALVSWAINLSIQIIGARAAGKGSLAYWAPTLIFYFPLATVAAWKGVVELATKPFFWDKTAHGLSEVDGTAS